MTTLNYCYHCGTQTETTDEMLSEQQNYCINCGTRLKFYQPYDSVELWMVNLTPEEEQIVDEIEQEMDAGYVISHNRLFEHEKCRISERRWKIEYFHSEFDKQFDRLKLGDREQFKSYVTQLARRKDPTTHKQVKQLRAKRKAYRLRVSYDVRAVFRLLKRGDQNYIRFILIGKQDHFFDLYKRKVSTSIQESDKYCSHCGHEVIHYVKDGSWIDELDPQEEEEKLLEEIELEIDNGHFLTHQRLFGRPPSLKEQQLIWGIKYSDRWNKRHLFHNFYIQDQKRFLVYVEELASMETPLEHSAVKELTNRRNSYRLQISPFARVIFSLEQEGDNRVIRFLKSGKEDDEYQTINGQFWHTISNFDYCLKCGDIYRTEDHSWMDVLEPGLSDHLSDLSEEINNGHYSTYEEVFGEPLSGEKPAESGDQLADEVSEDTLRKDLE